MNFPFLLILLVLLTCLQSCGSLISNGTVEEDDDEIDTNRQRTSRHLNPSQAHCTNPLDPFVIGLEASKRGQLEVNLKKGVVFVAYQNCQLKILNDCQHVDQKQYKIGTFSPKKEEIRISDLDELYLKIPFGAIDLAGRFENSNAFVLKSTYVGYYDDETQGKYTNAHLSGPDCSQATHVINRMYIGAFSLLSESKRLKKAQVDLMYANGGGESRQENSTLSEDGLLSACLLSQTENQLSHQCKALIKLELKAIDRQGQAQVQAQIKAQAHTQAQAQSQVHAQYKEEQLKKKQHLKKLDLEWQEILTILQKKQMMLAKQMLEIFLSQYQNHPFGNPYQNAGEGILANLNQQILAEQALKERVIDRFGIEWILIRGGSFMMGSDDWKLDHRGKSDLKEFINIEVQKKSPDINLNSAEANLKINEALNMLELFYKNAQKPRHLVSIRDFYMSKTEVTVGQYRVCVNAGACTEPNSYATDKRCNWTNTIGDRETYPVNCVDWKQARTFAKWVGGDLPSEAQWEYAARSGGKEMKYPWGNAEATCEYAVMATEIGQGCGWYRTAEVCSKTMGNTTQGLCDMGGNVSEWVLDEWHASYSGAPSDDTGWCSDSGCDSNHSARRVGRGNGLDLSSAFRFNYSPIHRSINLGFRVRY